MSDSNNNGFVFKAGSSLPPIPVPPTSTNPATPPVASQPVSSPTALPTAMPAVATPATPTATTPISTTVAPSIPSQYSTPATISIPSPYEGSLPPKTPTVSTLSSTSQITSSLPKAMPVSVPTMATNSTGSTGPIVFKATGAGAATPATTAKQPEPAKTEKEDEKPEKDVRVSRSRRTAPPPKGNTVKKPKKAKKGVVIGALVGVLVLAVAGIFVYGYSYFYGPERSVVASEGSVYPVDSSATFLLYFTHPSLGAGDTIQINSSFEIDINEHFRGFFSLPLVNIENHGGTVTFKNGTLLMTSARKDDIAMDGAAFDGTKLYIEAPEASITLNSPIDENDVNVAKLNGIPHNNGFTAPVVGIKQDIFIDITNTTQNQLDNQRVEFLTDMFAIAGGNVQTLDFAPGETVTVELSTVAVAGGHGKIKAIGYDSSGTRTVYGESVDISIIGDGYYAGDLNTHTTLSGSEYQGVLEDNVKYGYNAGLSFIASVETNGYGNEIPQTDVNAITGSNNAFLQIPTLMVGANTTTRKIIALNYPDTLDLPPSNYHASPESWYLLQHAVDLIVDGGGIPIIPHPFGYNNANLYVQEDKNKDTGEIVTNVISGIEESMNQIKSVKDVVAFDLLDNTTRSHFSEFAIAKNIWDNINSRGNSKMFVTGSSNELTSDLVGARYIKGYMPILTEQGVADLVESGNFFASNGPELRFTLGGATMGEDIYIPTEGDLLTLKVSTYDTVPLTGIKVLRFPITGTISELFPETVVELDLTGQGIYSYTLEEEILAMPECYYRVEVTSETAKMYDDIGMAFSNPIWVNQSAEGIYIPNNASVKSYEYEVSASMLPAVVFFGSSFDTSIMENSAGVRYINESGKFTPSALKVDAYDANVSINYHPSGSDVLADYVTIRIPADDGTSHVEKMYIVNEG